MKKILYYILYLLLLLLINLLPVSAKEIDSCIRTRDNLHVRDTFKNKNLNAILETPCVNANLRIYDYADLLTEVDEGVLNTLILDYKNRSNYDLVLVTISENPKGSASEFADDFYDYNDFGTGKTRDGVLLLIDMDTREYYISTTGYAIKMYDDARIERILDAGEYGVKNSLYQSAFSGMIDRLDYYYAIGFPVSNHNLVISDDGTAHIEKHIPYLLILIISSIVTLIIALVFYFISRLKIKKYEAISYLKNETITKEEDRFRNTIITHVPINVSSGSSSGGSEGGSSFHSSSSGSSHGGGGRGF